MNSQLDLVDEVSGWLVGGGVLTVMLFPVAVPILVLTVAAVIPLLLLVVVAGLVGAVVAAPVLLVRRLRRGAGT